MKAHWMWRAALIGFLLVLGGVSSVLITASPAEAASCQGGTAPCAEDPVIDPCYVCHSMTIAGGNRNGTDRQITLSVASQRHILGPRMADWFSTVSGMISKGAGGTADKISAYLNTNYCTTCNGPILSSATISGIASDQATVNWTTSANGFGDLSATSCVLYGTSASSLTGDTCNSSDPSYDPNGGNMVTTHAVTVTGLQPLTKYYVVHRSSDGVNTATYTLASSFTTPPSGGGGGGDGALGTIVSLAVGDYNNDFNLDLGVGVSSKNHVITHLGNGLGGFTPGQTLANVGTTPSAITTGGVKADFNEDGLDDLAVANFGDASKDVKVFFGTSPSGFQTTEVSRTTLADPPTAVVAGDFNEDGVLDLAVATVHTAAPAIAHVLILPGINDGAGHGTGSFGPAITTIDVEISTVLSPTITAITPDTVDCVGLPVDITITGTLLLDGASVFLDGSVPLTVISYSADSTSIVARIPNGTEAGTHSVTVEVGGLPPASGTLNVTPRAVGISSITPASRLYGVDSSNQVTISGINFTTGGTVSIGPLSGTTVSGTSATAANPFVFVTSNTIRVWVTSTQFPVGQYDVTVTNSDSCGGSATVTNGFTMAAPQPSITSVSDPSLTYGVTASKAITINGLNFVSGAQLTVDGVSGTVVPGAAATAAQPFVWVTSTRLSYWWNNTSLAPGPYSISVTNPSDAGGLSATMVDAITVVAPQPTVISLSVSSVTYGVTSSTSVTINGTNFLLGSVITVGSLTGATVSGSSATAAVPYVFVTSNQVRFWWPNTALAPGSYHVRVTNPAAAGGLFAELTNGFTVQGAVPTLSLVSPTPVTYGVTGSREITINGTNFVLGATVTIGSLTGQTVGGSTATAGVPFVHVTSSQIRFWWGNTSLPPGSYAVQVSNPAEAGGASVSLADGFVVTAPQPTLTNLSPDNVTYGITNSASVTVYGSNFVLGARITIGPLTGVTVAGSTATAGVPFVYTTSGQLKFYWANTSLPPDVYGIQVENPAAAGGLTASLASAFTVAAPQPTISLVSPSPQTYGVSNSASITINGSNFVVGSTVTVGTLTGVTVAGSTATSGVPFVVSTSSQAKFWWGNTSLPPGSYTVTVSNPTAAGGLSVSLADAFVVTAPQPVIDPSSVFSAAWGVLSSRAINIYGSGFVVGATVTVGSLTGQVVAGSAATSGVPFVLLTSGRIQFWWPNMSMPVGSYAVSVVNPAAAGGLSATRADTFVVTAPSPLVVAPITPSPVTYGVTTSRAITINGANFTPGSTITVGGLTGQVVTGSAATAGVPFVWVTSGRLSFWWNNTSLPVGTYDVTVTNAVDGGGLTNTLTGGFVVQ
ncbi:MAG: beta strand repeat-containing protein [Nitrospirota bacterium]